MKTRMIKMFVVLACMTFGIANVAKGQIFSSEECYYIEAGANNPKNGGSDVFVQVLSFDGNSLVQSNAWFSYIKRELKKGKDVLKKQLDYYQNKSGYRYSNKYSACQHITTYLYDSDMSTSKREVYKSVYKSQYGSGTIVLYIAVSNDKSSIIMWEGENIGNKKTFVRIDKEDLLPESVNYDFLNE